MYACVFEDDVRAAADLHMYLTLRPTPYTLHPTPHMQEADDSRSCAQHRFRTGAL